MAWAIWIFGSAFWSILALADAVRYFHSFTNGLGIVPPAPALSAGPWRSSSPPSSQVIAGRGQQQAAGAFRGLPGLGSRRGQRRLGDRRSAVRGAGAQRARRVRGGPAAG